MPKKTLATLALTLTLLPALVLAQPQSTDNGQRTTSEQRRERWQSMSPEERDAARDRARQRWQALSPEERQARRAAARQRFQSLPPEQQAQIRERLRQARAQRQDPKLQ
jgi:Protein of unknown function (DUF3106)